mgnify:CR=1 FL=1
MEPTPANNTLDETRREITFERRKELMKLAEEVAELIGPKVQPHERCLFRQAVEMLLGSHY